MIRPDVIIPVYHPDEKLFRLLKKLTEQTLLPRRVFLIHTGEDFPEEEKCRQIFSDAQKEKKKSAGPESLKTDPAGSENVRPESTGSESMGSESGRPELIVSRIRPEDFDHGGTRNQGAALSGAPYCVFMTQDAVPDDGLLIEKLMEPFKKEEELLAGKDCKGLAAVYARQLPAPDCRRVEQLTRRFNYPDKDRLKTKEDIPELGIKTFFCSNVCAAYRMDLFRELGGFPEHTIFNEDMIYAGHAVKAGLGIFYAAGARVVHSHNYSGMTQFHRNFDLAVSQDQHPEVFAGIRSESEGIRLVRQTAKDLAAEGHALLIPELVWTSGCKYLGYRLGKNWKKLPEGLVRACSWQKKYWDRKDQGTAV